MLQRDLREKFANDAEKLKKVDNFSYMSFRPNIVIDGEGIGAFEEERIGEFTIGGLPFVGLKGERASER